jgi:hypothetical protein
MRKPQQVLIFAAMKLKISSFWAKGLLSTLLLTILIATSSHKNEEGMFPLNYLNEEALNQAGLKLTAKQIFSPGEVALTSALVKVGGCTGSFISEEGLVITNHHCVYGGVAGLSTNEKDYLENGFVARDKSEELPINMPCRITQSYEDVSAKVLNGIDENTAPSIRAQKISQNIKAIIEEEKAKTPDLSVEISEMFVGRSYMLFRYLLMTDVRLAYAPPVTIGQFGGDTDNWEWPRHNGDFSMVRVYVGKDGKPAKYSKDNVPYKPAKHLKINAKGTKENDFVFIMGYPGRTFRHESGEYLKFQEDIQLPKIQKWYSAYIRKMRNLSAGDNALFLAFAGEIQSLENVEKNYRGKIQGLRRAGLVNAKLADDAAMHQIALSETNENKKKVIPQIQQLWTQKRKLAEKRYIYNFLQNQSNPFYAAAVLSKASAVYNKANKEERAQIVTNVEKSFRQAYAIHSKQLEEMVFSELLPQLAGEGIDFTKICGKVSLEAWMQKTLFKDKLFDTAFVYSSLKNNPQKLFQLKSSAVALFKFLESDMVSIETQWATVDENLRAIMPLYLEMKESFKKGQFIPDANSTLRLTYGYIKRYRPNDAEVHLPFTTLKGVFEKANSMPDYRLPRQVQDNLRPADIPSTLKDPETGEVIVSFLYNLDTTGGNSGSPVLDAEGNLIGVNFDRSFTATINDFAWNESYSRSIGCDIRYVLFVMKYVGKADNLLSEMGINL